MYSHEIERFLQERGYVVTPQECGLLVNVEANPQIAHIRFFCANNEYHISTEDNYKFIFKVK